MTRHAKASVAGSIEGIGRSRSLGHLGLAILAAVALLAFAAPYASAANVEIGSFAGDGSGPGGEGSGDGQLDNPGQADVNDVSGDLFVADTANNRVEVFSPTGSGGGYLAQAPLTAPTGLAIDQSTGDVYVANAGGVSKFDEDLNPIVSGWSAPVATGPLAVDPSSGDLLVADTAANLIRRFEADGTPGATFTAERPIDLAANSTGEILVVTSTGDITAECGPTSSVVRFSSSGVEEGTVGASLEAPGAVAVDPDEDGILIAANVNEYWCELSPFFPEVAFFEADGTATETVQLGGNAEYAMVPGLAARGAGSSRVYAVTKSPGPLREFGHTKVVALEDVSPPTATLDPVTTFTGTTAHFSGKVNSGGTGAAEATSYQFECSPTCPGLEDPRSIPTDGSDHVVEDDATDLTPNSTYEVTLVASNAGGQVVAGPQGFTTDAVAPEAETLPPLASTDTAAQLRGRVNPRNSATTYFFDLATQADFSDAVSVPLSEEGDAGSADQYGEVSAWATGLEPGTTYHYRLNAKSAAGDDQGTGLTLVTRPTPAPPAACSNEPIRQQQGAAHLSNCRAYEQVSPVEKYGYPVGGQFRLPVQLSVDAGGDRASWAGFYPLAGASTGSYAGWLTERDPATGWQTTGLLPTPDGPPNIGTLEMPAAVLSASTPDQRVSVYFDNTTDPFGALWVVRGDGSRQLIARGAVFQGRNNQFGPWAQGISDDGRHVLFTCKCSLVSGAPDSGNDILYEWIDDGANGGEGTLRVVNRTNDPTLTLIDAGPAELGAAGYNASRNSGDFGAGNAVSADGSLVFFQNPAPATSNLTENPEPGGPVYMRKDGTTTVEVSSPSPGYTPANPPTGFRYIDASHSSADPSVDGRYVFFWANGDLTTGASASGGIYRYDVTAETLSFLAQTGIPTGLSSDDGSHLYYEDQGETRLDVDGENRLIHDGAIVGGERDGLSFILNRGIEDERCPSANVSPDGRFFAFISGAANNSRAYLYDAEDDSLEDVSTGPDAPTGLYAVNFMANCGGSPPRPKKARMMSDDGRYVFFDTTASLVPEDTNDNWDAYEWHNGDVSLLGSGDAKSESGFVGSDASGSNAFIISKDRLAPSDIDAAADIYDARIDGGFLQAVSPQCTGESCLVQPSPTPSPSAAATARFAGPGNVHARKNKGCPKGRRHNSKSRCGKKHRKAKHRGKGHQGKRETNQTGRASR